jgi:hypothetical protein
MICGNPRHTLLAVIKGWLCWNLVVRPWPARWGIPPLLAHAGDWIFDARGCEHRRDSDAMLGTKPEGEDAQC